MMEVTFDITNLTMWMDDIAAKYRTTVTVQDCIPWHGRSGQALVHVPCTWSDELVKDLRANPEYRTWTWRYTTGRWWAPWSSRNPDHPVDHVCWLLSGEGPGGRGWQGAVQGLAGNDGSIPELIGTLKAAGMLLDIKKLKRYDEVFLTTKRQREMVKKALEKGYYDYPCRVNAKQLAEEFISRKAPCGKPSGGLTGTYLWNISGK